MSTAVQGLLTLGGNGVALGLPATPWEYTDWTEIEASMPEAGALAGLHLGGTAQLSGLEIEVGIGSAGNEDSVGHFRVAATSLTAVGLYDIPLPVPLDVLPKSSRVAVRARGSSTGYTPTVTLSYYPEPAFSNKTRAQITSAPNGEDSVSATTSGVAWEWTDWQELTPGEERRIGVYGLAAYTPILNTFVWEVQLGTGDAGLEDPIGTYRVAAPSFWGHILFPVPHAVAAFTRVSYRVRINQTTAEEMKAALLFYDRIEEAVIGPLAWVHKVRRIPGSPAESVTETYSDHDMQCPAIWENGFKEGLVTQWGDVERAASHPFTGEWQGSTFSYQIADKQNRFRAQAASVVDRYWNDAETVRMTTRANRALYGTAFTVFCGPIIEAQTPGRGLWDVTLGDVVSQGMLSDQAQVPWRIVRDGFLNQLDAISESLDRDTPEPILYGRHTRQADELTSPESAEALRTVPIYLGIMTISGGRQYHVWVVAGHAVVDMDAYVDDELLEEGFPVFGGPTWLISTRDQFVSEFGTPYLDMVSDTYGNDRRYTLILGRFGRAIPDACATGDKRLTASVVGIEDRGDGLGALITGRFQQYKHFLINNVANQGAQSYQSGAWLSNPTWDLFDGPVFKVDEESFDAATGIGFERLTEGYVGAAAIGIQGGDRASAKKWIADWNRSCGCRFGITHNGQMRISVLHPTAAIKAAAVLYTDAYEVLEDSFRTEMKWDQQATAIQFKSDFNNATGEWTTSGVVPEDSPNDEVSRNYGRVIPSEAREYPFAPGLLQASHLATLELRTRRHRPRYIRLEGTIGPDPVTGESLGYRDVFDYIRYEHFDAVSGTREERLAYVVTPGVRVGPRIVTTVALDCEDLIDFDVDSSP